jgi:hypothetical protein
MIGGGIGGIVASVAFKASEKPNYTVSFLISYKPTYLLETPTSPNFRVGILEMGKESG